MRMGKDGEVEKWFYPNISGGYLETLAHTCGYMATCTWDTSLG